MGFGNTRLGMDSGFALRLAGPVDGSGWLLAGCLRHAAQSLFAVSCCPHIEPQITLASQNCAFDNVSVSIGSLTLLNCLFTVIISS